jgi:carboxyl-terminal processing protease
MTFISLRTFPALRRQGATAVLLLTALLLAAALLAACSKEAEPGTETSLLQTEVTATNGKSSSAAQEEESVEVVAPEQSLKAPSDVSPELKVVWETWAFLTKDYVDRANLDPAKLSEAAIRGMLEALGDPHTGYVSAETMQVDSNDVFQGKFEGIGANVQMNAAGKIVIVAPIAGSPAEAAGIRSGDIILEVDGESIEGWSLLDAVNRIRGPEGTPVRLLVLHIGALDPIEVEIVRGVIPLEHVFLRSAPGDKIVHIRLTSFYPETAEQMASLVRAAVGQGAQGLILDLRDNPGGLLSSVIAVASQFLDSGLVLYQIDGNGTKTNHKVREGGQLTKLPMVVLVNQGSASASEVLTGALMDHGRATIIGSTTFGKGSVNILRPLSNGGGVWITTAHWFTPNGHLIQGTGIKPDIEVGGFDARDSDVKQLEKAREVLNGMFGT